MIGVWYLVRQATVVATAQMHSVITVKTLVTSPRTVQTRSLNQEHQVSTTGHTPNHITTTTIRTDLSPLTTDTAKEYASTSQDHTTDPTIAEAPAIIGGMHPPSDPTTTTACDTHQLTDTLDNTLTRTHCTSTTLTHLRHANFLQNHS